MARLQATDNCPQCRGPMKKSSDSSGSLYQCPDCDRQDPMKIAERWLSGGLKPPSK